MTPMEIIIRRWGLILQNVLLGRGLFEGGLYQGLPVYETVIESMVSCEGLLLGRQM